MPGHAVRAEPLVREPEVRSELQAVGLELLAELRDALLEVAALDLQLELGEPQVQERVVLGLGPLGLRQARARPHRTARHQPLLGLVSAPRPRLHAASLRVPSASVKPGARRGPLVDADHLERVDASRAPGRDQGAGERRRQREKGGGRGGREVLWTDARQQRLEAPAGGPGESEPEARAKGGEPQAVTDHEPQDVATCAAPRARRTPISCERLATVKASSPWMPTPASSTASAGEAGQHPDLDAARRGLGRGRSPRASARPRSAASGSARATIFRSAGDERAGLARRAAPPGPAACTSPWRPPAAGGSAGRPAARSGARGRARDVADHADDRAVLEVADRADRAAPGDRSGSAPIGFWPGQ